MCSIGVPPAFRNITQAIYHIRRGLELIEMAADDSHVRQAAQLKREPKGDPHLDDGCALEDCHEMSDPEWAEQACGKDVVAVSPLADLWK